MLAWFLVKAGACITIVEKAHALLPYGQNVDIEGSAKKVIKKMGLVDQVRRFNTTEKVKEGAIASPTSELEILRGDLAAVLNEATTDHPNVNYLFGTTMEEVVSNDADTFKDKLSNGEVQVSDLLVAADGQRSKVRKQCFSPESVEVFDLSMYVVYWTIPRLPGDNDWWNVYQALGSRVITLRPEPHCTVRAIFSRMPCNDAQKKEWQEASKSGRQTQEELMRREFADAG